MADDYGAWLSDLSKRTGAVVEQDDIRQLQERQGDVGFKTDLEAQYKRRGASGQTGSGLDSSQVLAPSDIQKGVTRSGSSGSSGGNSTAMSWNGQAAPSAADGMFRQMSDQASAAAAANKAKSDALYGQLMQRAQQGTAVSPNDPVIKAQTEAFTANTDRATRNYLADRAEQAGPYANLAGEQRMATERGGQAAGGFTAELMGRELTARRSEISDALNGMRGMLSLDQQNQLQRELAVMDDAIKRQGLSLTSAGQNQNYDLGLRGAATAGRGVDLGFLNAGNQNQQFYNELGLRANQYGAENYFRGAGL